MQPIRVADTPVTAFALLRAADVPVSDHQPRFRTPYQGRSKAAQVDRVISAELKRQRRAEKRRA